MLLQLLKKGLHRAYEAFRGRAPAKTDQRQVEQSATENKRAEKSPKSKSNAREVSADASTTSKEAARQEFELHLKEVREAKDPMVVLNSLTLDGKLSVQKICDIVITLYQKKHASFFGILASETSVANPAIKVTIDLCGNAYRGVVSDPQELASHWMLLKQTGMAPTKTIEFYFLVAAIQSESLELVWQLLDEFQRANRANLPTAYKVGILRIAAKESKEVYLLWRKNLALSELEELNILEIDNIMGVVEDVTHAEFPARLRQIVPPHLADELDEHILPFYEEHKEKLSWMDCRVNGEVLSKFIATIHAAIASKAPLSLIRLGDGEAYAWVEQSSLESTVHRETSWWGAVLELELRTKISSEIQSAIAHADILGVPSLFRITRDTNVSLSSYLEHRSISGLIVVLDGVSKLPERDRCFTEDRIHHICFDLDTILGLALAAEKVLVVSSLKPDVVRDCLKALKGKVPVDVVAVPTHTRTMHNEQFVTTSTPLPFVYEDVKVEVAEKTEPGTLVIVASGVIGKIFCQVAREQGGVALDVGVMVDYWVGLKTRSVADLV